MATKEEYKNRKLLKIEQQKVNASKAEMGDLRDKFIAKSQDYAQKGDYKKAYRYIKMVKLMTKVITFSEEYADFIELVDSTNAVLGQITQSTKLLQSVGKSMASFKAKPIKKTIKKMGKIIHKIETQFDELDSAMDDILSDGKKDKKGKVNFEEMYNNELQGITGGGSPADSASGGMPTTTTTSGGGSTGSTGDFGSL